MMHHVNLKNGAFDGMGRADLDAMLDELDASGRKLVVHFHGGLVSRDRGLATAARLHDVYEHAGAYPLFVVWQSGLGETIVHNLSEIQAERIFRQLLAHVLRFAVGKAHEAAGGTRAVAATSPSPFEPPALEAVYTGAVERTSGEPYAELPATAGPLTAAQVDQLTAALAADPVIREESATIAGTLHEPQPEAVGDMRAARIRGSAHTRMSDDVLEQIRAEAAMPKRGILATTRLVAGAIATVERVLARLNDGRAHGIYPTAVEELLRELYLTNAGGLVWGAMKQDTADAFGADADRYGGTALIRGLAARTPAATPVLVGHSTGAVYICQLLAHADAILPAGRRFDVVLLAPACDFALVDRTFAQHGHRIERLRVFCMNDERESHDQLVPVVYPRSLLYFVSGALESGPDWPLLGMQRFYADAPPFAGDAFPEIARVREAIARKRDSQVWSVADGGSGLASRAEHHGAFDDDDATLESVQRFIAKA